MWQYKPAPTSDELYHFGVLGMKWGRRRSQKELGNSSLGNNKNSLSKQEKVEQKEKVTEKHQPTPDGEKIFSKLDSLLVGTPASDKLALKRLKPPREEPMHRWSKDERKKFESDYKKAFSEIRKEINNAKTDEQITNSFVELYNLEGFYNSYVEWD